MSIPKRPTWSKGSEWSRWDPHLHTPTTALANQFPKPPSWDEYLERIEQARPTITAIGVTDYLSIDAYVQLRTFKEQGRLPGVELLFPNVEARLSITTDKGRGINLHLLFSPDDTDHVTLITSKLHALTFTYNNEPFCCTRDDLRRLGKTYDPHQTNEHAQYTTGVNQFKLAITDLRRWYENDAWLQRHCLIAIEAGTTDGTSGLRDDAFKAQRQELQRFAHIIFSARPGERAYWLGKGTDDQHTLNRLYGGIKPCLHGSDAHTMEAVAAPAGSRYCWIKAAPTFEGLRQTLLEPEERVWIGPEQPGRAPRYHDMTRCTVSDAPWLATTDMTLNDGIIAIIGPRGSGKTALADMFAAGAHAYEPEDSTASFLAKARDLLGTASVTLTWADHEEDTTTLSSVFNEPDPWEANSTPRVRYLSQKFVEQLCNAQGLDDALLEEIERVVFHEIDETERHNAATFADLRALRTNPLREQVLQLREDIRNDSTGIAHEQELKASLPTKKERLRVLDNDLAACAKQLQSLVVKGKEDRQRHWKELEAAIRTVTGHVTTLKTQRDNLRSLQHEIPRLRARYELERQQLAIRFAAAGLTPQQWESFRSTLPGDPETIVAQALAASEQAITTAEKGPAPSTADLAHQPLAALRTRQEALRKELGSDDDRHRRYVLLEDDRAKKTVERERLTTEIAHIGEADTRRNAAAERRYQSYQNIFSLLDQEQDVLEELYAPLRARLALDASAAGKLGFYVHRRVDINAWTTEGEALIDLRRDGPFQRSGTLATKAEELLGHAWRGGSPGDVRRQMDAFLQHAKEQTTDLRSYFAARGSLEAFATWLFSTDHVTLEYGIRYEGVPIERLSPGTRGIVLLLLYLAVDRADERPLLIDQPEENLDPQSVMDVLVPFLKLGRRRRQVIIVTHNPNLVVNTDADQVIVASAERVQPDDLPKISYVAGPLEDAAIRDHVCRILEGGEVAFLQRERRYAMKRRPTNHSG